MEENNTRKIAAKGDDKDFNKLDEQRTINEEIGRWKKNFTVAKHGIAPNQSCKRMQDFNNTYVNDVVRKSMGDDKNNYDHESFKKMEREQENMLKQNYCSEIDRQTDANH